MDGFIKITDQLINELFEKNWFRLWDLLPQNAKIVFAELYTEQTHSLISSLTDCESPIEQIMALRLSDFIHSRSKYKMELEDGIDIIEAQNQVEIMLKTATYRVDFKIPILDLISNQGINFIIECDGHDFHEKTKEQVARDKKRDRAFVAAGYKVIRFAGSEIWNDPLGCAHEALTMIFGDVKIQ